MKTTFCGIVLQSPFILGSGPLSYSAEGMIRAHKAGAGAVVTKTIRDIPANNPYPHMASLPQKSMINAEKWSDISGDQWVSVEIPKAKTAHVVVIASIGHTEKEVRNWVEKLDAAGADMVEIVSYDEETMVPMILAAKQLTRKPVIAKLSPNWRDPLSCALKVAAAGADAITAMDSVGPVLRINISTGKPLTGGAQGLGWLTGSAIKPIILHHIAQIAKAVTVPIIGLGGVMHAEDAIEMMMVGAGVVGVCTAPILKGVEYIGTLIEQMDAKMQALGFKSFETLTGYALENLGCDEDHRSFGFTYNPEICTSCMKCIKVCAYESRTLKNHLMEVDLQTCRGCGLCASVCPVQALKFKQ